MMPKHQLMTGLLVLLGASLSVGLVCIWHRGERRIKEPETLAHHSLTLPDLSPLQATPSVSVDLLAIRDNAVFYTHRSFYQPPHPGQSVPVPEYEFAGSMALPQGKKVAFVRRKSDKSNKTVHVGDDLDGWRVELIDPNRVVLARDAQQVEIKAATSQSEPGLMHAAVGSQNSSAVGRSLGLGPRPLPATGYTSVVRTLPPPPAH
jgi:hypothetical protein